MSDTPISDAVGDAVDALIAILEARAARWKAGAKQQRKMRRAMKDAAAALGKNKEWAQRQMALLAEMVDEKEKELEAKDYELVLACKSVGQAGPRAVRDALLAMLEDLPKMATGGLESYVLKSTMDDYLRARLKDVEAVLDSAKED